MNKKMQNGSDRVFKNAVRAIFCATLISTASAVSAAQLSVGCVEQETFIGKKWAECTLRLSGEISRGDADRLLMALRVNPALYDRAKLEFDSPGGDVEESLKLASIMKRWLAQAVIPKGATCASACFLIWVGSPQRIVEVDVDPTQIGLHRPHFPPIFYQTLSPVKADALQREVIAKARDFLQQQNLSQRLIDEMMRRRSNDIYWLTKADVAEIGGRSPYIEELLVAECGYKSHAPTKNWTDSERDKWLASAYKAITCHEDAVKNRRPSTAAEL